MSKLRHIASIFNSPLLALDARCANAFLSSLVARSESLTPDMASSQDQQAGWVQDLLKKAGQTPYFVSPDGATVFHGDAEWEARMVAGSVAVLPIKGVIVKECWDIEELFFMLTSMERITEFIHAARTNDKVVGMVQRPYSPGGMVYGIDGYINAVAEFKKTKHVATSVDCLAASCGYWTGCQGDTVLLDGPTSEVGSVGVMTSWWDIIPLYEALGAKWREYYAPESANKNEEWRAIREKENSKLLEEGMSQTAQVFQKAVMDARGAKLNLKDKAVLAGRVYQGQAAIDVGLADAFGTLNDAIDLVRERAGVAKTTAKKTTAQVTAPNSANSNNNTKMSLKRAVVAILASAGIGKVEATDNEIKEINEELVKEGISNLVVVNTTEQTRLANAAKDVAAANTAKLEAENAKTTAVQAAEADRDAKVNAATTAKTEAEGKLAAANTAMAAMNTALDAAVAEHGIATVEGTNALELVLNELKSTKAALTAANAEIATLKGEDAPDENPAGAANKEGDKGVADPVIAEGDAAVKQMFKS